MSLYFTDKGLRIDTTTGAPAALRKSQRVLKDVGIPTALMGDVFLSLVSEALVVDPFHVVRTLQSCIVRDTRLAVLYGADTQLLGADATFTVTCTTASAPAGFVTVNLGTNKINVMYCVGDNVHPAHTTGIIPEQLMAYLEEVKALLGSDDMTPLFCKYFKALGCLVQQCYAQNKALDHMPSLHEEVISQIDSMR